MSTVTLIMELGLASATVALARWRVGVILIFVWVYLEDIIRRLLPDQPPETIFIKEITILATYFSFTAARVRLYLPAFFSRLSFLPYLIPLFGISLFASFISVSSTILTAGLGIRTYFWYVPLALLGHKMFAREKTFEKFVRVLVYTSIPLACFAAFQRLFRDRIDFVLMWPFERSDKSHSFLLDGSIPFITSIFGSHSRYGHFSYLLFLLGLALLGGRLESRRSPLLMLSTISAAAGVFLSGQRTPMYLLVIGLVWFIAAMSRDGNAPKNRAVNVIPLLMLGIVLALTTSLVIFWWFPDLGEYFLHLPSIAERFLEWAPEDIITAIKQGGLFGVGFGVVSQGVSDLGGPDSTPILETIVEGGVGKVWLEMGAFGVVAFYLFAIKVFRDSRNEARNQTTPFRRRVATVVYIFFVTILFEFSFLHHQVLADATTLIPLWFLVGVVFQMKTWQEGGFSLSGHDAMGASSVETRP